MNVFARLPNKFKFTSEQMSGVLFVFFGIMLCFKAYIMLQPHFIWSYPFISYDGFQWITDSNHYLDFELNATHRNPLLPLTFAVLKWLHLVDYFPILIGVLTWLFFWGLFRLGSHFAKKASVLLALFCFFNVFKIHNFFDYVLADPWCLTAMVYGLDCLIRTNVTPRYLIWTAFFFGIAFNYQFAPAFLSPILIWFLYRSLGLNWFKVNQRISILACVIFLTLALPQFIYKWIYFGSPFYSHVIHFPLIEPHLFSLPSYAVGYLSFLGWPLGLMILIGSLKHIGNHSPQFQLIYGYGLTFGLFWITLYLWFDVRFLLYLVPAWFVFFCLFCESYKVTDWLRFKRKTIVQGIIIIFSGYFTLTLPAQKNNAFESFFIALTPSNVLRFSSSPLTQWGVPTLTFENIKTENSFSHDPLVAPLRFLKFYKRQKPHEDRFEWAKDAEALNQRLQADSLGSSAVTSIGIYGGELNSHENKHRIFFTLSKNIKPCDNLTHFCVAHLADISEQKLPPDFQVAFRGSHLALLQRTQ